MSQLCTLLSTEWHLLLPTGDEHLQRARPSLCTEDMLAITPCLEQTEGDAALRTQCGRFTAWTARLWICLYSESQSTSLHVWNRMDLGVNPCICNIPWANYTWALWNLTCEMWIRNPPASWYCGDQVIQSCISKGPATERQHDGQRLWLLLLWSLNHPPHLQLALFPA